MKTTWKAGTNYRFENLFDAKSLLGTFIHSPRLKTAEVVTKQRNNRPEN